MGDLISDEELAALGLVFDAEEMDLALEPEPIEITPAPKPAERILSQADIDALLASMNS